MKKLNKKGISLTLKQIIILILVVAFAIFIITQVVRLSNKIITPP
jgi:hypothetical protein